jgi:hypothetical protein
VKNILDETNICDVVYDGVKKVSAVNKMFIDGKSVEEFIKCLKHKNSEGIDRIPQRVLADGASILTGPFSRLFKLIYDKVEIPDQWKIAKTVPKRTLRTTGP